MEKSIREKTDAAFGPKADASFATLVQPIHEDIIGREAAGFFRVVPSNRSRTPPRAHAENTRGCSTRRTTRPRLYDFARAAPKKKKGPQNTTVAAKVRLKHEQDRLFGQLDDVTAERCRLLQRLALERLELKAHWAGADYRFLPLFQQTAKRLEVPLLDLAYAYALEDFQAALLLGKTLPAETIRQRRAAYAV